MHVGNAFNSLAVNKETDKLIKQISEQISELTLRDKIKNKEPLNNLFSKETVIAINKPLNYKEINLLAKLFINNITNLKTQFITLDYISKNIPFSLVELKEALLNPTKTLVLQSEVSRADELNIKPYIIGDIIQLPIHFNDELQCDNYVDFQLRFIFSCIYIYKRKRDIRLLLDTIKLEDFKNSFNLNSFD